MFTVLVLASSPLDQAQLHLGKESKLITRTRESSRNRDQFRVVACMATTPDDLRAHLLEYSPAIVHFCGHGAGPSGLCFETEDGGTHLVSGESLAKLFHLVADDVRCVVLSACYSEEQAQPISEHIDFVVGMSNAIGDEAALKFAEGFYQAVWAGQSIEKAFKFGCSAIDTAGLPDEDIPRLLRSPRLGGLQLPYGERVQELENFILRYINTPPAERAALTVEGAEVDPIIRASYKSARLAVFSSATVLGIEDAPDGSVAATAVIRAGGDSVEYTYYIKETHEGLRLQWKATNGYWDVPAKTLRALGSAEPVIARVIAEISDYYNYGYLAGEYVSTNLRDLDGTDLWGFISVRHPQCRNLVERLRDGGQHRLTLALRLTEPGRGGIAEINEVISNSWVVDLQRREAG